jgi:hypothetical protein
VIGNSATRKATSEPASVAAAVATGNNTTTAHPSPWERSEHIDWEHAFEQYDFDRPLAVRANGTKLACCTHCNRKGEDDAARIRQNGRRLDDPRPKGDRPRKRIQPRR